MIPWLLQTFAAITALAVAVLILRRPVARLFGAGWAYSLWLIPALRVVLPPLGLVHPHFALPAAADFIPAAAGGTPPLPAIAGPGQWVPFLLATWAGGAVIFLVLQWLAHRDFLRRLAGSSRPARPPRYRGILTFVSEAIDGPLALGLLRRLIVVPSDFSRRYSPGERRLAMEHEATHHRRGDIWWNMAAMLLLAANWFNPVAWIAYRAFRADQELACDAAVAARASPAERCDYARALVKSAAGPGLIAACPLHEGGDLKQRLRMMRLHRTSRPRTAGGLAAVGALGLTAFALGGPEAVREVAPVLRLAAGPAAAAAVSPSPAPVVLAAAAAQPRPHARPRLRYAGADLPQSRPAFASADVQPLVAPPEVSLPRLAAAYAPRPAVFRLAMASSAAAPSRIRTAEFIVTDTGIYIAGGGTLTEENKAKLHAVLVQAMAEATSEEQSVRLARVDRAIDGAVTVRFKVRQTLQGD
ncbi:MAG: bla regulator protein blaR1 [Sphingomonadales bacterium]|nr:bla regulator protein blaR1 [Sphingomonadales bacterium]